MNVTVQFMFKLRVYTYSMAFLHVNQAFIRHSQPMRLVKVSKCRR